MKKFIFGVMAIMFAGTFAACGNKAATTDETVDSVKVDTTDTAAVDTLTPDTLTADTL